MIRAEEAEGRGGCRRFLEAARDILRPFAQARLSGEEVMRMLVERRSAFLRHATVRPFLLTEDGADVGHFALISDHHTPQYAQAAFFGARPGLRGVDRILRDVARRECPGAARLVVGLNGHLNYSAGLLATPHEEPPLFGLNWTPPYYLRYFRHFGARPIVSYRFDLQPFFEFARRFDERFDPGPVRVRTMDRRALERDVAVYTDLNNACFGQHPYWSNLTANEDMELFRAFRLLLKEENLLFAEQDGEPIGFLLWYPDFHELLSRNDERLGIRHVLRFHLANPIRAVRLTEIAVRKEFRRGPAVPALLREMIRRVANHGYERCEAGFIFEENRSSLALARRFIERATGRRAEPSRRFVVFEAALA